MDGKDFTIYLSGVARREKNRSLTEIVPRCGVDQEKVDGWFHGKQISDSDLEKIAEYLGVSAKELMKVRDGDTLRQEIPEGMAKNLSPAPTAKETSSLDNVNKEEKKMEEEKKEEAFMPEPEKKASQGTVGAFKEAFGDKKGKKLGESFEAADWTSEKKTKTDKKKTPVPKGPYPQELCKAVRKASGYNPDTVVTKQHLAAVPKRMQKETEKMRAAIATMQSVADGYDKALAVFDAMMQDYLESKGTPTVEARYAKLLAAAKNATDEEIAMATTMLSKFHK